MAKGYWIGRVEVNNEQGYKPYADANPAIFKKFGAKYVVRGGKYQGVEGQSRSRNVVIEFADYATAVACYNSPEYQANLKSARPTRSPICSSSRATTVRSPRNFMTEGALCVRFLRVFSSCCSERRRWRNPPRLSRRLS